MTPTPKPLTEAEIAEIRARMKDVTPGPWEHGEFQSRHGEVGFLNISQTDEMYTHAHAFCRKGHPEGFANANFIIHARTDVPRLLDAHASLVSQLDAAEERERGLREALEIIAGKRQCLDNLMSNADVARAALRQGD